MAAGRCAIRLVAAGVLAIVLLAAPSGTATACACGALIPEDEAASVTGEHALVWWDGNRERIDLQMVLDGRAEDAAWIMPAPQGTEVSLGRQEAFETLATITRPRWEAESKWWPPSFWWFGGGAGEAGAGGVDRGVERVGQSDVGPFRVTTLSGDDPSAVNRWLVDHGYPEQRDLPDTLAPYLRRDWNVLAVKLRPGASDEALDGMLEPLRLTFETDEVVYPIQLSQTAESVQNLRIYVIAPHRMDIATQAAPGDPAEVAYAGWVKQRDLEPSRSGTAFVTRFDATLDPAEIERDYTFERSASDEEFQRVHHYTEDRTRMTGAVITFVLLALVTTLGIRTALRRWW